MKKGQPKKDEGENEDAEIENVCSKQSHASQSQAEESEQSASTGPAEPPPPKKPKKDKAKGRGFREAKKATLEASTSSGSDPASISSGSAPAAGNEDNFETIF